MKTRLTLLIAGLLTCSFSFATHCKAGELTYKLLDSTGLYFQVSFTSYTSTSYPGNLADRSSVVVFWGDGSTDTLFRVNGPAIDSIYHAGEDCDSFLRKNIYTGTHHYAGPPPSPYEFYVVGIEDQNRIANILNIANRASDEIPMYLEDTIYVNRMIDGAPNNSPVSLESCVTGYVNLNDTVTINPAVSYIDGDSLYFELATPLQGPGSPVPAYRSLEQICVGQSLDFNHQTGQLTWIAPCSMGLYSVAWLVKEYRCGELLGTMHREMTIAVYNENNDPPVISSVHDTIIQPGDSVSFMVTATDFQQPVLLNVYSSAFALAQPPTVYTSTTGNTVAATITWQTGLASAQKGAYIFTVAASDNYTIPGTPSTPAGLTAYTSFRVWVADTSECVVVRRTGINDVLMFNDLKVFPNPFSNELTIAMPEAATGLRLMDVAGRVLLQQSIAGQGRVKLSTTKLAAGLYFLEVNLNGQKLVRQMVKQ